MAENTATSKPVRRSTYLEIIFPKKTFAKNNVAYIFGTSSTQKDFNITTIYALCRQE